MPDHALKDAAQDALRLLELIANRMGAALQGTDMDTQKTRAKLEKALRIPTTAHDELMTAVADICAFWDDIYDGQPLAFDEAAARDKCYAALILAKIESKELKEDDAIQEQQRQTMERNQARHSGEEETDK